MRAPQAVKTKARVVLRGTCSLTHVPALAAFRQKPYHGAPVVDDALLRRSAMLARMCRVSPYRHPDVEQCRSPLHALDEGPHPGAAHCNHSRHLHHVSSDVSRRHAELRGGPGGTHQRNSERCACHPRAANMPPSPALSPRSASVGVRLLVYLFDGTPSLRRPVERALPFADVLVLENIEPGATSPIATYACPDGTARFVWSSGSEVRV